MAVFIVIKVLSLNKRQQQENKKQSGAPKAKCTADIHFKVLLSVNYGDILCSIKT